MEVPLAAMAFIEPSADVALFPPGTAFLLASGAGRWHNLPRLKSKP
jgi:hypothetical protein